MLSPLLGSKSFVNTFPFTAIPTVVLLISLIAIGASLQSSTKIVNDFSLVQPTPF